MKIIFWVLAAAVVGLLFEVPALFAPLVGMLSVALVPFFLLEMAGIGDPITAIIVVIGGVAVLEGLRWILVRGGERK